MCFGKESYTNVIIVVIIIIINHQKIKLKVNIPFPDRGLIFEKLLAMSNVFSAIDTTVWQASFSKITGRKMTLNIFLRETAHVYGLWNGGKR